MSYQPDLYDVVTPSALQGDVERYAIVPGPPEVRFLNSGPVPAG